METLLQDIRFGVRRLLKSPGFAAIAVISLALGIGANTAIFSLVNTILLRPFPVTDPQEIFAVAVTGKGSSIQAFSYPTYLDFRDRNEALAGIFATRPVPMSLSRDGQNERAWGYLVSGNYFDVLGVKAHLGRAFTQEEDRARLAHPVVVISHAFWQNRFGASPGVIGKEIIINGHTFNIIGVAPEGFIGTELIYTPDIWAPMMMQPWIEPGNDWMDRRGTHNIFATGRLKPGITREQAESSLNVLAQQLGKEYPDDEGRVISLVPTGFILPSIRGDVLNFTWVLMATVGLVLLIACTNLANLLLARGAERRREIAIRLSLGANRFRIVRQLLTENLLLSLVGGTAGFLLAKWIVDLALAFKPPLDIPLTMPVAIDWRVLVFSLVVSIATTLVFGLVPALQTTKPGLVPALKDAASQSGHSRSRLRSALVVAQIALSFVLLIAAGLVVRALQQVQTMNPGFEIENGLKISFDLGLQGYDQAKGQQFHRQVIERVQSLPGVRSASLTDLFPLSLNYSSNDVYVEGQPPVRGANVPTAMVSSIGLNYFATMGTPLVDGRDFTEQDDEKAPRVVIVNEAFVRKFFPEAKSPGDGVGRRISFNNEQGPFIEIVGVAKDGKYWTIGEAPQPFIYSPLVQSYNSFTTLVVRTTSDSKAMISAIRSEVRNLDAHLPLYEIKTFAEHLELALFPARIAAALLGAFGILALTLAAIGIYGVTAYSVAQRTREIGIRVAIGAQPLDVLRLILKKGLVLALIGLTIGLAVAFVLTPLMADVLYGVSATDPVTFIGITLLLMLITLAACYVPARRASKVDPMVALRYE
ncbi:MAG: ABC transporter permease [Blastocatellia bacterium]|nr:ABC transporter permease [Blastocatellia bacterium]